MLSYTGLRNLFGNLVNNSDSTILTIADTLLNERMRFVLSSRKWWFLEKAFTATTDSANQFVPLPGNLDRILSDPYITIGTINYTPRECPSRGEWDRLNLITFTSDIPSWWYSYNGKLGFFPKAATSGKTITINGKIAIKDLSEADYTTGTITTTATASAITTVTGSGTTWTGGMVGSFLRITQGAGAALGDGVWYEIATVASATSLTLVRPYGGTNLAAASANYTIGQMPPMPEAYHALILHLALQMYYTTIDPNPDRAAGEAQMAGDLLKQMEADHSSRTGSNVLDDGITRTNPKNPNLFIGF